MPHTDSRTITFGDFNEPEHVAKHIYDLWCNYEANRSKIEAMVNQSQQMLEADRFYPAGTGEQEFNPWENRTTLPKMAQIQQIYLAKGEQTLFPSSATYFDYVATINPSPEDQQTATKDQKEALKAWMRTKLEHSKARQEIMQCYDDYLHGNAFLMVEYVHEQGVDENGEPLTYYRGPRLRRIRLEDIGFNSRCRDFIQTPKIVRTVMQVADVVRQALDHPQDESMQKIKDIVLDNRSEYRRQYHARASSSHLAIDGEVKDYYDSGEVELLTYYGDFFDDESGELKRNHKIIVVDRCKVGFEGRLPTYLPHPPIFHAALNRQRNSQYGLGLYYNLQGLQYRIDHLANGSADARDRALNPVMVTKGGVAQDIIWGMPDQHIELDVDASIDLLVPPTEMLASISQELRDLLGMMEEMAGAPREALGIRSPGEKTAFEVQELFSASEQLMLSRLRNFEEDLLVPAFQAFQEMGIRQMSGAEAVNMVTESGSSRITEIRKEDLLQSGRYVPRGARYLAEKAKTLRFISQVMAQGLLDNPTISPHISGLRIARMIEDLGDLSPWDIVEENIALAEQMETQSQAQIARGNLQAEENTGSGLGSDPELTGLLPQ